MSLRIGVDMDGTLADLSSIYHEYEETLFGTRSDDAAVEAEGQDGEDSGRLKLNAAKIASKQREAVWTALRSTPNFWTQLKPLETDAVRELYAAMLARNWEVFFITQRPRTAGASVQAQTQKWLIAHGFETPSVLTLTGSRGKAAHALDLDFLIDDLPKNCIDVVSDSRCRPILVLRRENPAAEDTAKRMNIGVVRSVSEAIELLKQPSDIARESMVTNVLRRLGLAR
jgi:hypothetical protein